MNNFYDKTIEICERILREQLSSGKCQKCSCPPDGKIQCSNHCTSKRHCEDCLIACFNGDDNQKNSRYGCVPITCTYVLKFFYRYASEIYRIFLNKKELIQKLNNGLVFSLGCGPASELYAINELIKTYEIQNCTYCGYDINSIWDTLHGISYSLKDNNQLNFTFRKELLKPYTENLEKADILILNYVASDLYVHQTSNSISLGSWLDTELTPIVDKMKFDSYVIINDVNSRNMGRNEIQEWAWNLSKTNSLYVPEFYSFEDYFKDHYHSDCYNLITFDSKVFPKEPIKEKDFIFPNTNSILQSNNINFRKPVIECGSCFVVLQKK